MLVNFSIKNFGPIKEEQILSFEASKNKHLESTYVITEGKLRLLKIAFIYGANASGKTTILKALDFLRALVVFPKNKKDEELNYKPFLFDDKSENKSSTMNIEFIQNGIKYFYSIEFNQKYILNESLYFSNPKKALVFKRVTDVNKNYSSIEFGNKINIKKIEKNNLETNTLSNNTVLSGYLKTNIDVKELYQVTQWFKNYLNRLIHPKSNLDNIVINLINKGKIKITDVLKILQRADFNISNIIIEKRKEFDYLFEIIDKGSKFDNNEKIILNDIIREYKLNFEHTVNGKNYKLPLEDESNGTKTFFGFAGILHFLINNSTMFSIDELDSSLHPELYKYFILAFLTNSFKSQLLITTHNREILNDKDLIRDDALWITDKSNNSASTELYSFYDFDSSVIRDTTNRLNAYKTGKLGGIPNLSDYYF